jgi:hypothetical protein
MFPHVSSSLHHQNGYFYNNDDTILVSTDRSAAGAARLNRVRPEVARKTGFQNLELPGVDTRQ